MYINWLQEDLGLNPYALPSAFSKAKNQENSPLPLVNEVSLCNQQGALVEQRGPEFTLFFLGGKSCQKLSHVIFLQANRRGRAGLQDKTQTTALKKIGTAEHEGAACTGQFGPGMFL